MVYARAYYDKWPLNIEQIPLDRIKQVITEEEYYSFVAYVFLEGLMFEKIKEFKKYYVGDTKDVLDRGNMTSKVCRIIAEIKKHKIMRKEDMVTKWEANPWFVMDVFNLWVRDNGKDVIKAHWPPI